MCMYLPGLFSGIMHFLTSSDGAIDTQANSWITDRAAAAKCLVALGKSTLSLHLPLGGRVGGGVLPDTTRALGSLLGSLLLAL